MRKTLRHVSSTAALTVLILMAMLSSAMANGQLTQEKALTALKPLAPDIKIMSFQQGPLGLWEVGYTSGGQVSVLYIDNEAKYILLGSLLELATKTNLTKERFEELTKVDVSQIPLEDTLVVGDAKAKNKVIVFSDPDCPYCQKFHQEMKNVVKDRKDIAFFIKLFPLKKLHPESYDKSRAIACEKDKAKALKMLEQAYDKKAIPKATCDSKAIDANLELGTKIGIDGTPAVIFPDGKRGPGMMSADTMIKQIDAIPAKK